MLEVTTWYLVRFCSVEYFPTVWGKRVLVIYKIANYHVYIFWAQFFYCFPYRVKEKIAIFFHKGRGFITSILSRLTKTVTKLQKCLPVRLSWLKTKSELFKPSAQAF